MYYILFFILLYNEKIWLCNMAYKGNNKTFYIFNNIFNNKLNFALNFLIIKLNLNGISIKLGLIF